MFTEKCDVINWRLIDDDDDDDDDDDGGGHDDVDKHKFCVIFGVGACKYRTEVVEDLFDNPVFNTECDMWVWYSNTNCLCTLS